MILKKILLQKEQPRTKEVLWAYPKEEGVELRVYDQGEWVPKGDIATNLSLYYTRSEIDEILRDKTSVVTSETTVEDLMELAGIDASEFGSMEPSEATAAINEALSGLDLASEEHGQMTFVEIPEDAEGSNVVFVCEDGYLLMAGQDGFVEYPPYARYLYEDGLVVDEADGSNVPLSTVHNRTNVLLNSDNGFLYYLVKANPDYPSVNGEDPDPTTLNENEEIEFSTWATVMPTDSDSFTLSIEYQAPEDPETPVGPK